MTRDERPVERPSLDRDRLDAAIKAPWTGIELVDVTDSTNADLLARSATALAGTVRVAEYQQSGRGRLDRTWTSPPRAGLTFSVLLRPGVPASTWGWLPLLSGLGVRDAVATASGVDAVLKWPNDLLLGAQRRKAAGLLAQAAEESVVVGVGLNVTTSAGELPPEATSLALEGVSATDRTDLLVAILAAIGPRYLDWQDAGGDAIACGLAAEYLRHCATIGQQVTVSGTDGTTFDAMATGIDQDGRLTVLAGDEERVVAAGDVQHVRGRR